MHEEAKMTTKKSIGLILMVLMVSTLAGCDDQKMVLPKVCEYFPDSALYQFDKRVIWIQTRVDGISGKTAAAIFEQFCQQAEQMGKLRVALAAEFAIDGHRILVVGFRQGIVAWDIRDGVDPATRLPRFQILNWSQEPAWFTQHLGYVPRKDQTQIISQ